MFAYACMIRLLRFSHRFTHVMQIDKFHDTLTTEEFFEVGIALLLLLVLVFGFG